MRELTSKELRIPCGGGHHSAYTADEIVTVSTSIGHSIGTLINSMKIRNYQSSVNDLADSLTACRKMLKGFQGLVPLPYVKTHAASAVYCFGCGIYMALVTAAKKERSHFIAGP